MSAVKDVYDLVRDLVDEAKRQKNLELQEKLMDIQSLIFDIREENEQLKSRVAELEKCSILESELELLDSGLYVKKTEKESGKNIRYCASCFQMHGKLIPVALGNRILVCPNCKTAFH